MKTNPDKHPDILFSKLESIMSIDLIANKNFQDLFSNSEFQK